MIDAGPGRGHIGVGTAGWQPADRPASCRRSESDRGTLFDERQELVVLISGLPRPKKSLVKDLGEHVEGEKIAR
jgi:hypothetical protein